MEEKIKLGSQYFIDYIYKSLKKKEFFFDSQKIDFESLVQEIGETHSEVLNKIKDSSFSAKAMRWINNKPTAFKVQNSSAAEVMIENNFLILIEEQNYSPIINDIKIEIAKKLNINDKWIFYKISLSSAGAGVGLHFDRTDSIHIHIFGNKSWQLDLNPSVHFPLSSYAYGEIINSELLNYISENDLRKVPKLDIFNLKSGDCFFVKSGMWHTTQAFENSCTILFQLKVPCFIDFINSQSLKEKLIKVPQWRNKTYGMWEENHFNQRGKQILIDLAKSFNIDISEINFNYENN